MLKALIGGLVVAAAVAGWFALRRARRAHSIEALQEIVREVGYVVATDPTLRGTELEDVSGGFVVLKAGADRLRLPLHDLVSIHLQYPPEQRRWHYAQVLAEAQRQR
ncbi:MAG: hypothetical protein R3F59_10060 [Myxococcota bacterium]